MRRSRIILLCAFAAAFVPAAAAPAEVADTAVKAAFLPRFAHYVTWPASAIPPGGNPFALCVVGGDPFGQQLDEAARSQSIDGRRIVVKHLDSAQGADACQIAFVDGTNAHPTGQILAALARDPVLTVTDANSSGQRGIIHFVVAGGRVRFFIDQSAAAQRGLTISSRLLALAVGVKK